MRLQVGTRGYLLPDTISGLESRLDPHLFIRLHRSVIVRKDRIARLSHDRAGAWHAELTDGETVRISAYFRLPHARCIRLQASVSVSSLVA